MASDETMTFQSSLQDEDLDDDIIDDGFHHHHLQHPHPHNLSRLSVCTSSTLCSGVDDVDDVDDVDNAMTMYVSRLSIGSFEGNGDADADADADGELSDGKEDGSLLLSSDSENEEVGSCYSLPATPPRRRNRVGLDLDGNNKGEKDYASDNEAQNGVFMGREKKAKSNDQRRRRRSNRRSVKRGRWGFDRAATSEKKKEEEHGSVGGFSGDSDQSGGTGVVLITRPKGGKRSLCMGLEEVKACRDLGFELEHERMLEMPSSRLSSFSNSTLETTSSGGNSPIANWRISGPGDDPRDVKARLKVWAQAVALASASKYGT